MLYSSKTCEIAVINNRYHYVNFKRGTTQEYDELMTIYDLLKREATRLPILYDMSQIDGMDYEALDFSLTEWSGFESIRLAIVFGKDTISEKYARIGQSNQKPRPTLKYFNNILEATVWLLTP